MKITVESNGTPTPQITVTGDMATPEQVAQAFRRVEKELKKEGDKDGIYEGVETG